MVFISSEHCTFYILLATGIILFYQLFSNIIREVQCSYHLSTNIKAEKAEKNRRFEIFLNENKEHIHISVSMFSLKISFYYTRLKIVMGSFNM